VLGELKFSMSDLVSASPAVADTLVLQGRMAGRISLASFPSAFGAGGRIHYSQGEAELPEVPVVERVKGGDIVVERRVRQEEVIYLRPTEPAKPPKRSQHLRKGAGRGGDQGEHRQVFFDLREDRPMWNAKPGQNGEKLPYGLLRDARPKRSCSGAGPEGKTEVGMVQGRGRGPKKDPRIKENDAGHVRVFS